MARIESEGKGGYYPTPPEISTQIVKRLNVVNDEGVEAPFLDPCCGKGLAIRDFKDLIDDPSIRTFGIELERSRAKEADQHVDRVAIGSYDEVAMTSWAFPFVYLNPPFMEYKGERMEKTFLANLSKDRMAENAVMVLNLPQYVLPEVASIIARRFKDVRVYRYTNDHYDVYKQVIVYARRRPKGIRSDAERQEEKRIEDWLIEKGKAGKTAFPVLDQPDEEVATYDIYPSNIELKTFKSMAVDEDDILEQLQDSSVKEQIQKDVESKISDFIHLKEEGRSFTAAMPLKTSHLASVMLSGILPSSMASDHLLVGVQKKVKEKKQTVDEKTGREQEITLEKTKNISRIFSTRGIFDLQ